MGVVERYYCYTRGGSKSGKTDAIVRQAFINSDGGRFEVTTKFWTDRETISSDASSLDEARNRLREYAEREEYELERIEE